MRRGRVVASTALGWWLLLGPAIAWAQPEDPPASEDDWAEAGKLFHEGRKLMGEPGGLDRGCELLSQSYEKRRRGDTLLNLAECHRRQGKTATAWREFDEAIRYAKEVEFAEAIAAAEKLRDELAKDLSGLMVEVVAGPPKLRVLLDNKLLPSEQWGQPLFVDPGPHAVSATADGYEKFEGSVEVKAQGDRAVIRVALKKLPPKPEPPKPKPPPPPPPPTERELPVWAIIVGSGGIAMLGVSIGLGVDSLQAGDELNDECGEDRLGCSSDYDFESARSREVTGFGVFVGFGIGGLLATGAGAIGLGLGLSEPSRGEVSVSPWSVPGGGGLSVSGRF